MKKDADISSLEHTAWRCQYHVVFTPKYRRMEIYGVIKQDIGLNVLDIKSALAELRSAPRGLQAVLFAPLAPQPISPI